MNLKDVVDCMVYKQQILNFTHSSTDVVISLLKEQKESLLQKMTLSAKINKRLCCKLVITVQCSFYLFASFCQVSF